MKVQTLADAMRLAEGLGVVVELDRFESSDFWTRNFPRLPHIAWVSDSKPGYMKVSVTGYKDSQNVAMLRILRELEDKGYLIINNIEWETVCDSPTCNHTNHWESIPVGVEVDLSPSKLIGLV